MQCFGIACLMSILWLAFGYSIAFRDGIAYWGGLDKAFLIGITEDTMAGSIPEVLFNCVSRE
jgi:Amt family ammonium transporter